jgi:hypothetical protein
MHRRRQGDNEFDDIPVLTDSVDTFEEIPVLTEIEPIQEYAPAAEPSDVSIAPADDTPLPPSPEEAQSTADSSLRDDLIRDLTSRIEDRIKAALPEIISSTIREFLVEQETIANS